MTAFVDNRGEPWNVATLNLPREALVSHLGFDLQGGICRHGGTTAGRLLIELIRNTAHGDQSASAPAGSYMRLAVYDLVGALFAPADPWPWRRGSRSGDLVALRPELFTERGSTCSEFIYSLRQTEVALVW